jgi:hypothetical protein
LFQEKYQILTNSDGVNVSDASTDTGMKIIENYLPAGKCINRTENIEQKKKVQFLLSPKDYSTKPQYKDSGKKNASKTVEVQIFGDARQK